jgi:hypothetical protein
MQTDETRPALKNATFAVLPDCDFIATWLGPLFTLPDELAAIDAGATYRSFSTPEASPEDCRT